MQLSIKDSDLKGVFNLEVEDIVFPLCKDNIRMLTCKRKGAALFHVCIVLCPTWVLQSHGSNSAFHVQNKHGISQGSLCVLRSSQSLLNYLLKSFLNRHCSFSSAVVNSLYLALPGCWDFQSWVPCRYPLFIVLSCIETQNARPSFTSNRAQFHHGTCWTIATDKSFTVSGYRGKRGVSNVVTKVSVLQGEEWMAVLCWTGGSMNLRWDFGRVKGTECDLTWVTEASWTLWRAPAITSQGFQWEAPCPAHHEALRREQWTSDRFDGAGQSLRGQRLGSILSQHAQMMHRHSPNCWFRL